jgi:hypothetical protein
MAVESELVSSGIKLVEQGGVLGVMLTLGVAAIVVLYRMVISKLLQAVITITSSVKEITTANTHTAELMRGMITDLKQLLVELKKED